MRKLLLYSSIVILAVLFIQMFGETICPEYRTHQKNYRKRLMALAETDAQKAAAEGYDIKLRQLVLPDLDRTDRCVSCHVGIEDPRMADAPKPLAFHSQEMLAKHDIRKIGCTVCHDGQGLATKKDDAHANEIHFWEKIRLKGKLVQANCLRCHHVEDLPDAETLQLGRKLFAESGCLGCHKNGRSGGFVGPDLTLIGDASFHLKSPEGKNRKELLGKFNHNVNLAYLFESVKTPGIQEDSQMVDNNFSDEESFALAVYMKSFQTKTVPDGLQHFSKHVPQKSGRNIYLEYCAACHGADGEGAELVELDKLGPALASEGFQAMAEHSFVKAVVADSGSSVMPAWGRSGGLSEEQVELVSRYVLTMKTMPEKVEREDEYVGNPKLGAIRFESRCSGCHGIEGKYEMDLIGPSLASPEFKTYATPEFLEKTIAKGRKGTAMPAWYFLTEKELKDIVAYVARDEVAAPSLADCVKASKAKGAAKKGASLFESRCAACHGFKAEGRIGPSLNSPELQALASDKFFHDTIVHGRSGTAMGGWSHLSASELGKIMAYLRTFKKGTIRVAAGEAVGSESKGKVHFESGCVQCHGENGMGLIGPAIGGVDFLNSVDDQFLRETISHGRSGTAMRSNLEGTASFADLSGQQINEVIAYMRLLQKHPVSTLGKMVTQGDIPLGKRLFARTCAQCHGKYGSGEDGPGIGRPGFLATVSDGFIEGTIANGRTGTEMRGFSPGQHALAELEEKEIRAIVAYLRSGVDADKLEPKRVFGTASNGAELFTRQCGQCHGSKDTDSFAPRLMNPKYLSAVSDAYLQATMSMGHGSSMRSMIRGGGGVVEMTSKEINDVISYLRAGNDKNTKKK